MTALTAVSVQSKWLLGSVAVCGHCKKKGVHKSEMVLRCQVEQKEE